MTERGTGCRADAPTKEQEISAREVQKKEEDELLLRFHLMAFEDD